MLAHSEDRLARTLTPHWGFLGQVSPSGPAAASGCWTRPDFCSGPLSLGHCLDVPAPPPETWSPGQLSGRAPWPQAKSALFCPALQSQVPPSDFPAEAWVIGPNPWNQAQEVQLPPPHRGPVQSSLVLYPLEPVLLPGPKPSYPLTSLACNHCSPGALGTSRLLYIHLFLPITQTVSEDLKFESQAL